MSFKMTVVLLLSVAVFICFASEVSFIPLSSIGNNLNDRVAAQTKVDDFLSEYNLELLQCDVMPLYGYGYNGYVGYAFLFDTNLEAKRVSWRSHLLSEKEYTRISLLYGTYVTPYLEKLVEQKFSPDYEGEEVETVDDISSLVPQQILDDFNHLSELINGYRSIMVLFAEDVPFLAEAGLVPHGFYATPEFARGSQSEEYGENLVGFGISMASMPFPSEILTRVGYSVHKVYEFEGDIVFHPTQILDVPFISGDLRINNYFENSRDTLGVPVNTYRQYGDWDCYYTSLVCQLDWHLNSLGINYDTIDYEGSTGDVFHMNCYRAFSVIINSINEHPDWYDHYDDDWVTIFPPEGEWKVYYYDSTYWFYFHDSQAFCEIFYDALYAGQDDDRNLGYTTDESTSYINYRSASTEGNDTVLGNVSIIYDNYNHFVASTGYEDDVGGEDSGKFFYMDPVWGTDGHEYSWTSWPATLCLNAGSTGDGRIVISESMEDAQFLRWVPYLNFDVKGYTVLSRDEAGQITQLSGVIRANDDGGWQYFETEAEGELGVRYYPAGNGEPVDVFDGEEFCFE